MKKLFSRTCLPTDLIPDNISGPAFLFKKKFTGNGSDDSHLRLL